MKTVVRKWGNSLGIRIPKTFASEVKIGDGAEVDISVHDGRLVIKAIKPSRFSLEKLLAQVTVGNIHEKVDWGIQMGKEAW
jgi:antitoxin MazE